MRSKFLLVAAALLAASPAAAAVTVIGSSGARDCFLAAESHSGRVDFRCARFPGLISALTLPAGGTSDYAPEMIHAAARGENYGCFVRSDTQIPFMAMPDGVDALLALASAPRDGLQRTAYNVGAFSPTAEDIRKSAAYGGNVKAAVVVGKKLAELAKSKGINKAAFDRGHYRYHGRIKALADAAREGGLQF